MPETLRQKQSRFFVMTGQLIAKISELGFEATWGDAYRDQRCHYGLSRSLHQKRLAVDINLFRDGRYLQGTRNYLELGEWWESIGGTWGGRFGDGNHFSLEHGGVK